MLTDLYHLFIRENPTKMDDFTYELNFEDQISQLFMALPIEILLAGRNVHQDHIGHCQPESPASQKAQVFQQKLWSPVEHNPNYRWYWATSNYKYIQLQQMGKFICIKFLELRFSHVFQLL